MSGIRIHNVSGVRHCLHNYDHNGIVYIMALFTLWHWIHYGIGYIMALATSKNNNNIKHLVDCLLIKLKLNKIKTYIMELVTWNSNDVEVTVSRL